jgi:hypothetical protein
VYPGRTLRFKSDEWSSLHALVKSLSTLGVEMPSWCLQCGSCALTFAESFIADDKTMWGFLFPAKPALPIGGSAFECPHCGHERVYVTTDFIYRA